MANIFQLVGSILIDDTDARRSLDNIEESAGNVKDKLGKIGDGVGKAGAVIGASVGVAGGLLYKLGVEGEDVGAKLQAGLGLSADEADKFAEKAKNLYKGGWGESLGQVTDDLIIVKQTLEGVNETDLEGVTGSIMNMSQMIGSDTQETATAIDQLMVNFGISHTEAMDLIVAGTQQGLNANGDLLDSINEYSPQFEAMGMSSDRMFAIFKAGADGGAMSVDKVADAVKEFNVRASDGSKGTAEGFEAIGMDAEEMGAKIAAGGAEGERAFQATVGAIMALEDPVAQQQAGVALFGTQWEDLQAKAVGAMAEAGTGLEDTKGSLDGMNDAMNNTTAVNFASTMRELGQAFEPLAKAILDLVNDNLPAIKSFAEKLADMFENANPAIVKFGVIFTALAGIFGVIMVAIAPVITAIGVMIPYIVKIVPIVKKVITVIRSWGAIMAVIAGGPIVWIIAAVVAVVAIVVILWKKFEGFRNFVKGVWNAILGIIQGAIRAIVKVFVGIVKFIGTVLSAVFSKVKSVWSSTLSAISTMVSGKIEAVKSIFTAMKTWVTNTVGKIFNGLSIVWSKVWDGLSTIVSGTIDTIKSVVGGVSDIIDGIVGSISNAIGSIEGFISKIGGKAFQGAIALWNKVSGGGDDKKKGDKPEKNANGTKNFGGGLSVVGEQGRELVQLPQGSRVYSNPETENILGKSGGGVTQHITVVSPKSTAIEIARKIKQASRQLATE